MKTLVTVLIDRVKEIDSAIKSLVDDRKTTIAHIELEDADFKPSSLKEYTLVSTSTVVKGEAAEVIQPREVKSRRAYVKTDEYRLDQTRDSDLLLVLCNSHGMKYSRKTIKVVSNRLIETGHIQVINHKYYPTQLGKEFIGMKVSSPQLHFYTNSFKELVRNTNLNNI